METTLSRLQTENPPLRASFAGIVRGELMKISWQRFFWVMLALLVLGTLLIYTFVLLASSMTELIQKDPMSFFNRIFLQDFLQLFRAMSGMVVIVTTTYLVGVEYQLGTIRVLLGRGVGRIQLLLGKLTALLMLALALTIVGILFNMLLLVIVITLKTGSMSAFSHIPDHFMSNIGIFALGIFFNLCVSIAMATGVTVIGRSITFGLCVAVAWFPIDNMGTIFMILVHSLLPGDLLPKATAYVLGPNLNMLGTQFLSFEARPIAIGPGVSVSAGHMLTVALVYVAIFLVTSIVLTWKRDVKA